MKITKNIGKYLLAFLCWWQYKLAETFFVFIYGCSLQAAIFANRSRMDYGVFGAIMLSGAYVYLLGIDKDKPASLFTKISQTSILLLGVVGMCTMDSKHINHRILLFLSPYIGALFALITIGACHEYARMRNNEDK